jgi:hypothetical protein
LSVPAGSLDTGRFAQCGPAADMPPDPLLATVIDTVAGHVRIIEDETRILSAEDAAKADAVLAEIAGSLTFGKLRAAAHRLGLELDPDAARRRKETHPVPRLASG